MFLGLLASTCLYYIGQMFQFFAAKIGVLSGSPDFEVVATKKSILR